MLIEEAVIVKEMDGLYNSSKLESGGMLCGSSWSDDGQEKDVV